MTYERALEKTNELIRYGQLTFDEDNIEATEVIAMSIRSAEALEKQIPKKPVRDTLDKAYLCPTCNSSFTYWRGYQTFEHKPNYCDACGQAIDWEWLIWR